ncbi:sigma-E processing peptidase SpoIIGA [uncultured Ruminococcus sp.]|uniref:sigma-E processing peptidase SpoIIGA n=1 Tax=uncultured Ruminococcus sp. TaxID=165186 RepID=UPI0026113168|nr:sigma-E processing peptidase SpoIIGA [uncultured Ruminococcus sp.]
METIYVDVLIVLNIYVNFFLLRITAGLTHSPLKNGRCAAASVYGSLFSLTILLPQLGAPLSLTIKLAAAVSIVAAAFGYHGFRRLMINTAAFFGANFVLAGAVYGAYSLLEPQFIHFNNACFYIDFSLLILIITTAVMYFALRVLRLIWDRAPADGYSVIIRKGGRTISLNGLADTGNCLVDFFTGSPVLICPEDSFAQLTGAHLDRDSLPRGFRLLPCSTVSGEGLIPVFRPDEVLISCGEKGGRKKVDAVVGFGECGGKAVFNPKLLKI